MKPTPTFAKITLADFLVRSAYQMGKTPLLPLFAASLGASDVLLGLIVSVSTLTGMVTKPLFGLLSDRMGRRLWLLIGTLIFAGVPFLYRFIDTPGQLIAIRLLHGTATAIYGPVTVAFVAERSGQRKAERLGWFGMARSGGYIVGPALAGWLLLTFDPVAVFTLIGGISLLAFLPVALLRDNRPSTTGNRPPTTGDGQTTTAHARHTPPPARRSAQFAPRPFAFPASVPPAVWLSGGLEAAVFIATYAIKAFLPVYALTAGYSTAQIGLFFSLQEGALILLKPFGGRLADRLGYLRAVALGMTGLGLALPLLPSVASPAALLGIALAMGAAQALIFPATLALIAEQMPAGRVATGIGLAGSLQNAGKVAGPVLGGLLIAGLGYGGMFWLLAGVLILGAGLFFFIRQQRPGTGLPRVFNASGD